MYIGFFTSGIGLDIVIKVRNIPYLGSLESLYFLSKVKTAYFIQGTRTRTFRKSGPGPLKKAYPIPKFTV